MINKSKLGGIVALMVFGASWLRAAEIPPLPDGYVVLDTVTSTTCLAVRVTVPSDQAVSGLRWFNGAVAPSFDQVLVASGSGLYPPVLDEAVAVADSVVGSQESWSELEFTEPVGSSTGSLFLVMQYPPDYEPLEGITPLGVGYQNVENKSHHFVTADGVDWIKVSSRCQLMMEPVFCAMTDTTMVKSNRPDAGSAGELPLPKVLGLDIYPNPFNPVAKIQLALPIDSDCSLRVYDLRGCLVRDLKLGHLTVGYHEIPWHGQDDRGQPVGSGVYFAQVRVGDKTLNHRMVMVK